MALPRAALAHAVQGRHADIETQQWHEAREAGRTAQMRRRMLDVSKGTYAFLNEFQSPYVAASKAP